MGKDLERAKAFQRSLWEAAGKEWTESSFTDRWVFSPYGADWDEWQKMGLMPIDFCPLCGDDDLTGGATVTKQFSLLNVQIPACADCVKAHPNAFPKEDPVAGTIANIGCIVIPLLVIAGIIFLVYLYFR